MQMHWCPVVLSLLVQASLASEAASDRTAVTSDADGAYDEEGEEGEEDVPPSPPSEPAPWGPPSEPAPPSPPPYVPGILTPGWLTPSGDPCDWPYLGEYSYDDTSCIQGEPIFEPFCTTCPPACRARAIAAAKERNNTDPDSAEGPCLESKYATNKKGDPASKCDPACNNVYCDYDGGDCGIEDIMNECLNQTGAHKGGAQQDISKAPKNSSTGNMQTPVQMLEQAAKAKIFGGTCVSATGNATSQCASASSSVPVGLQVMIEPLSLTLNTDTNAINLETTLQYRVQWTDRRLMTMPCRGAISELLEVRQASTTKEKERKQSDKEKQLWVPTPSVQDQTKQEVKEANIIVGERLPWLDPASVPAEYAHHDACPECAVYMEKSLVKWEMKSEAFGNYRRYPFDEHQINLTLSVADGDLYSCETALRNKEWRLDTLPSRADDPLWNELLLPPTKEWTFKPESSTVRMQHGEDGSVCVLHLTIRRNYAIFFTKQVLITILITFAGMLALKMDPQDHTGDRVANILLAALICIVNYQVDLGIGKLQYLIWWDEFNLAHLFVLVIALLETIYAHRLVVNENEGKAREMDHFAYWFIQAGVYPVLLVALAMWGALENGQPTPKQSGDIVLGVGLVVVMLASVAVVLARARLHERKKAQLLARLGASQGAVDLAALRGLFRMYEVANLDGDVNIGNVRELMRACYPNVERKLFKTAMETMREHFDEDAVSSHDDRFDLFVQALLAVVDVLGEWPATKLATTDHPRISKGLAGWMKPEGRV